MIELGGNARFTQEALQGLAVVEQVVGNKLQRNAAAKASVFRLVYHPHPTATQLAQNVIVGNGLADHVNGPDHVESDVRPALCCGQPKRNRPSWKS